MKPGARRVALSLRRPVFLAAAAATATCLVAAVLAVPVVRARQQAEEARGATAARVPRPGWLPLSPRDEVGASPESVRALGPPPAAQEASTAVTVPIPSVNPFVGRVGMASHLFWLSESDARVEMSRLAAGGVRSIREDFRWDQLEPTRGSFNWTRSDALMGAAATVGIDVVAILDYSAKWASSDPSGAGSIHYPPKDPADYARFAAAVVNRYGRGGSFWASRPALTPRPLLAVEIWNEPWGYWFWQSGPDPAAYARLTRAAASAVRSADRGVKVVAAGDLMQVRRDGTLATWLDSVLAADPSLGSLLDAWTVHPYPAPRNAGPYDVASDPRFRFDRVRLVREVTVRRAAPLPLWLTEFGWTTATAHPDGVSETTQANYIRDALIRALVEFGSFVERAYVYSWDRSNGVMTDAEGNYGLRRADNSTKPAWDNIVALLTATPEALAATLPVPAPAPLPVPTTVPSTTTTTAPAPRAPVPTPVPVPVLSRSGYWMVSESGQVFAFGDARHHGDLGGRAGGAVDLEPTPTGNGYWLVTSSGQVAAYGNAVHLGNGAGLQPGETVTSLSAHPSGAGYWLFTTAGRVMRFGVAPHHGDLGGIRLNAPVLDSIPTPSGNGYYMVAGDGGIFAFGDAVFRGSMGGHRLNAPVQSLVPTADGTGYWLVASDGGIFAFGNAPFRGSTGNLRLNAPVTGMVRYGNGYLMVATDGGIFTFSDRPFAGSLGNNPPPRPITSAAALG